MTSLKFLTGPCRSSLLVYILAVICLTPTLIAAQGRDDDVITVDSSIVLINAAVTDRSGKAVPGLMQRQFHVFEDGSEQEIKTFAAEQTPFAAVILIDSSGSMESRISMARSAAIRFLDGLRSSDVAAVYHFASKVDMIQDFSSSRDIAEKVFDVKADGMTVLNDAVFQAANLLAKRPENRRAIIVLSDGEDTMSGNSAEKALRAALAAGATIYTVDMSSTDEVNNRRALNQGVLKNFATRSGGTFVEATGGPELRDAFKRIVEELGSQYTIAYQPKEAKKDGKWHAIEVRIDKANLTIRSRKGYHAPKGK
jgi:Ca-activated chloride channel family protein